MKQFILAFILLVSGWAWAGSDFQGLVELSNKQKIYSVHYQAQSDQPTVILINGLTYTTKAWDQMVLHLTGKGFGVLAYDPRGMGETLAKTGPATDVIPLAAQVEDLALLMNHFSLKEADLAGLSYGGAVALQFSVTHPEKVRNLILLAPYVKPLKQQDDMIKNKVQVHRWTFPFDKRSDDELYDYYLKQVIFQTYPIYEPVIKEHPWRLEAVFRMVQGVRKFVASDVAVKIPNGRLHMVIAGKDQYVPRADHDEFLNKLSKDQKVSVLTVTGSEHKLPEAVPQFMAAWVQEIVKSNPTISEGREFTADPKTGLVKHQGGQLQLDY